MLKDLLPIGSVVLLKEGTKKLMITGIQPASSENPDKVYDYIGVMYPEGFLSTEYNFLFNHADINDIIFMGYNNPEREEFIQFLQNAYDEEEKKKENKDED